MKPATSDIGSWETYTIKVPVEKNIATTKVTLKIPSGVEFQQYEPVPGWKVEEQKDNAGKVKTVVWEATGEGILPVSSSDLLLSLKIRIKSKNSLGCIPTI